MGAVVKVHTTMVYFDTRGSAAEKDGKVIAVRAVSLSGLQIDWF